MERSQVVGSLLQAIVQGIEYACRAPHIALLRTIGALVALHIDAVQLLRQAERTLRCIEGDGVHVGQLLLGLGSR